VTTKSIDHPTEFSAKLFGFADEMDVDGYLTMLTDDIRFRFANEPVARGKDAVREVLTQLTSAVSGIRHTVLDEWRVGDHIIHKLQVTYTRRDGSQVRVPAATIYRLSGDQIGEYQTYVDLDPVFN